MQEWTDEELNWYLERLANNDAHAIAGALFQVAELHRELQRQPVPTGNAKVITHMEQLLEDHRWCIVEWIYPYAYGELRWLAARVLACEYAYKDIKKPIILKDVIQPIRLAEIDGIKEYYQITTLKELLQQELLPTKTEIIKPQDYAHCCSKEAVEKRRQNQDKEDYKE